VRDGLGAYLVDRSGLVQINGTNGTPRKLPCFHARLGGTAKTVEEGIRQIVALLPQVNDVRRETIAASEIVLDSTAAARTATRA